MEVPAVAERVNERLQSAFGDAVLAVGWYAADRDE